MSFWETPFLRVYLNILLLTQGRCLGVRYRTHPVLIVGNGMQLGRSPSSDFLWQGAPQELAGKD